LCYQLFSITENSKHWSKNFVGFLLKFGLDGLMLNTDIYPGYDYCYIISKLNFFTILLFLCVLFYIIKQLLGNLV
jgi:hypothetical protein